MPRYKLKDKCVFVDAYRLDDLDPKKPDREVHEINSPFVMDKRSTSAKYTAYNDVAGFITRFIVMGVSTKLIPDILKSEYGSNNMKDPAGEVERVVTMLKADDFLDELPELPEESPRRSYQAAASVGGDKHSGIYPLDFKINIIGNVVIKGPL